MRPKIPVVDGLSCAISRLVYLVAGLLEEHFKKLKLVSPYDYAGFDLEVVDREEAYVALKIRPRGWGEVAEIYATFHRQNRHGKYWSWSFGGGRVLAPGACGWLSFEPMRDAATGKIILGKVVSPAQKVPLTTADIPV